MTREIFLRDIYREIFCQKFMQLLEKFAYFQNLCIFFLNRKEKIASHEYFLLLSNTKLVWREAATIKFLNRCILIVISGDIFILSKCLSWFFVMVKKTIYSTKLWMKFEIINWNKSKKVWHSNNIFFLKFLVFRSLNYYFLSFKSMHNLNLKKKQSELLDFGGCIINQNLIMFMFSVMESRNW